MISWPGRVHISQKSWLISKYIHTYVKILYTDDFILIYLKQQCDNHHQWMHVWDGGNKFVNCKAAERHSVSIYDQYWYGV